MKEYFMPTNYGLPTVFSEVQGAKNDKLHDFNHTFERQHPPPPVWRTKQVNSNLPEYPLCKPHHSTFG